MVVYTSVVCYKDARSLNVKCLMCYLNITHVAYMPSLIIAALMTLL